MKSEREAEGEGEVEGEAEGWFLVPLANHHMASRSNVEVLCTKCNT